MLDQLTLERIRNAAETIAPYVRTTPCLERTTANATLCLKAENLQPIGAFKLRGAFNKLLSLPEDGVGVVAHSSGNHAQAVARAAQVLGRQATIVMPSTAPPVKRARTAADGARIVEVGPDSDERANRAHAIARDEGLHPVEPYDDLHIAAGQGTAALELIQQAGTLDRFYAPVSGGGLMAGCSTVVRALLPNAEIVAVEPQGKDALAQSFANGERTRCGHSETIADGLRCRAPGVGNWPVLQRNVNRVVSVTDGEMICAMAWALTELRIVLEPSGAAALAAALREGQGRCGVILTGGNAMEEHLAQAFEASRA